jgi:hypothetical protein
MKKKSENSVPRGVASPAQPSDGNRSRLRLRSERLRVLHTSELRQVVGASGDPACYSENPTVCHTG